MAGWDSISVPSVRRGSVVKVQHLRGGWLGIRVKELKAKRYSECSS